MTVSIEDANSVLFAVDFSVDEAELQEVRERFESNFETGGFLEGEQAETVLRIDETIVHVSDVMVPAADDATRVALVAEWIQMIRGTSQSVDVSADNELRQIQQKSVRCTGGCTSCTSWWNSNPCYVWNCSDGSSYKTAAGWCGRYANY